jgi:heat shock protein HslJ
MIRPRVRPALLACAAASAFCALSACSGVAREGKANLPPVTPIMIPPPMAAADSPGDLVGPVWHWQATISKDASRAVNVSAPARYTVQFAGDGQVRVQADCNRGSGRYMPTQEGGLTLSPIATTKMGCPAGSLDTRFLRELGAVGRYRLDSGALMLESRDGAASMRFVR